MVKNDLLGRVDLRQRGVHIRTIRLVVHRPDCLTGQGQWRTRTPASNTHPTSHHNGPHRSDVGSGRDTYLVLDYQNKLLESSQCCTSVITTPCDDTDEITLPKAPQTSFRSPKQVQYPVDSYSTVILNISAFKKINCYVHKNVSRSRSSM